MSFGKIILRRNGGATCQKTGDKTNKIKWTAPFDQRRKYGGKTPYSPHGQRTQWIYPQKNHAKTMLIGTDSFELTGVPLKSRQNNFLENLSQFIARADRAKAV